MTVRKTLLPYFLDSITVANDIDACGQRVERGTTIDALKIVYLDGGVGRRAGFGDSTGLKIVAELVVHPCNTLLDIATHILHFCLVAAPQLGILVDILIHDGPTREVEGLRLAERLFPSINVAGHIVFGESAFANLCPYLFQLVLGSSVIDYNIIDKGAHIACTAALGLIDIVGKTHDGIGAIVVLKS